WARARAVGRRCEVRPTECGLMRPLMLLFTLHFGGAPTRTEQWTGADKVKHFLTAAFVESGAFSAFRAAGLSRGSALVGAVGIASAVSVGEELYDRRPGGDPSLQDLA